jgi:hypothetical protein
VRHVVIAGERVPKRFESGVDDPSPRISYGRLFDYLTMFNRLSLGANNPVSGGGGTPRLVPLRQAGIFSDAELSR